jgi:geranylgeranyl pyrophosphate synthase
MSSKSELTKTALAIIEKRGRGTMEKAIREILKFSHDATLVSAALKYYATVTLPAVLPIFPALMSLSCEGVGGNPEKTVPISTAMVLITSAGDIHDDIIDRSSTKYSKKTVLGKFGPSVALMAGDALLVQGQALLQTECETLEFEQRRTILHLIPEAFLGISEAEAKELQLRKRNGAGPNEYLEIAEMKGVVAEVQCKIGGIVANAGEKAVLSLGHFGRVIGMLSTIKDEFDDVFDFVELKNRLKNEVPPMPIIYALQDSRTKGEISLLLEKRILTRENAKEIAELTFRSGRVKELVEDLNVLANKEMKLKVFTEEKELGREAYALLRVLAAGLKN